MNQRKINKREFIKSCTIFSAGIICRPSFSGIFSDEEQKNENLKLAMFQEETPRGVMCRICPNECVLKEGEVSQCNNRKVIKSKLYTMAFGNPCSVNVDPIEKNLFITSFPAQRLIQ